MLKVTDLLLQSGGFGMVVLDLGDIPPESARRVPLTSWFRFRRAVEPTATVLLLVEQEPCAKTCASLVVRLEREAVCASDSASALTRSGWRVVAGGESERSGEQCREPRRIAARDAVARGSGALLHPIERKGGAYGDPGSTQRKPAQSAGVNFELRATW